MSTTQHDYRLTHASMHGRLPNRCHKATATLRLLLTFHTTMYARKASPMPSGGDCKGSGPLRVQSAAGRSVRTRHSAQQVTMRRATASSARAAGSRADAPERTALGLSTSPQLVEVDEPHQREHVSTAAAAPCLSPTSAGLASRLMRVHVAHLPHKNSPHVLCTEAHVFCSASSGKG